MQLIFVTMKIPMLQNVEELLLQLIDIPSPSRDEKAVCEFVYALLSNLSFDEVRQIPVDEGGFTIYARKGDPRVALEAHLDVVSPHLPARIEATRLYGRGSCDTKGSAAAMIVAAQQALNQGLTDFALIFTVREETNFAGITALVAAVPKLPFTIVGEPSNLKPVSSHYGILSLEVEAKGKAAHTSQAEQGINAIDLLVEALNDLRHVPIHPESIMTLVLIDGGRASNIVPDHASAKFSFRIAPSDKTNYLQQFSQQVTNKSSVTLTKTFETAAVQAAIPEELAFLGPGQMVKYFTELSVLQNGLILGPGDIAQAHTADEFVEKAQLHQAVELYFKCLEAMTQSH